MPDADPSSEPPPVGAAVEAALSGDAVAWGQLFDRYQPSVYRYCMAHLRNHHAAEDVTQEVFMAAITSLRRLRERNEAGVEGWLIGIARHKVSNFVRADRRAEATDVRPASAPDVESTAIGRLTLAELYEAMDGLTEEQRDLLVRRFILDHALEQVAADTGRTVGAVKSMQHRALESMRQSLRLEVRQ